LGSSPLELIDASNKQPVLEYSHESQYAQKGCMHLHTSFDCHAKAMAMHKWMVLSGSRHNGKVEHDA